MRRARRRRKRQLGRRRTAPPAAAAARARTPPHRSLAAWLGFGAGAPGSGFAHFGGAFLPEPENPVRESPPGLFADKLAWRKPSPSKASSATPRGSGGKAHGRSARRQRRVAEGEDEYDSADDSGRSCSPLPPSEHPTQLQSALSRSWEDELLSGLPMDDADDDQFAIRGGYSSRSSSRASGAKGPAAAAKGADLGGGAPPPHHHHHRDRARQFSLIDDELGNLPFHFEGFGDV